jgi:hypothetical protein
MNQVQYEGGPGTERCGSHSAFLPCARTLSAKLARLIAAAWPDSSGDDASMYTRAVSPLAGPRPSSTCTVSSCTHSSHMRRVMPTIKGDVKTVSGMTGQAFCYSSLPTLAHHIVNQALQSLHNPMPAHSQSLTTCQPTELPVKEKTHSPHLPHWLGGL